jgi:nicotinamide mononucleotide transporter PnuC
MNTIEKCAKSFMNTMREMKEAIIFTIKSFPSDIKKFKPYEIIAIFIFAILMITFSIIDINVIINKSDKSIMKYHNYIYYDNFPKWRAVMLIISGIVGICGLFMVVLASKRLISTFLWGIIFNVLFGFFSFAYGYAGNAQLYILYIVPIQFIGMYRWYKNMSVNENENDNINDMNVHINVHDNTIDIVNINNNAKNANYTNNTNDTNETDDTNDKRVNKTNKVIANRLTLRSMLMYSSVFCIVVTVLFFEIPQFSILLIGYYPFHDNIVPRLLDSISNGLIVIAYLLMLNQYVEQWIIWFISNTLRIAMFSGIVSIIDFNVILTACIFTINSLYGLTLWTINYVNNKKKNNIVA